MDYFFLVGNMSSAQEYLSLIWAYQPAEHMTGPVQHAGQTQHHILKHYKISLPYFFLTGPPALIDGTPSGASESKVAGGGT